MRLLRFALVIFLTGMLLAATVAAVSPYAAELISANKSEDKDIDLNQLDSYAVRSYIYSGDGTKIATLHGKENRSPVTLDVVALPVVESILGVEDSDFYIHGGVNVKANFRALLENVSAGGIEQGGSTITQQLVKNAILNSDQDFGRKSEEVSIAVRLEQKLARNAADKGAPDPTRVAKDTILEKYLNTVYFGSGSYGVQAAAETYWQKSANELGWVEGSMLAALISNPVANDPKLHPDTARKQRQIALDRLAHLGKITTEQAVAYGASPLPEDPPCEVTDPSSPGCGGQQQTEQDGYFAEEVKLEMLNDPQFNLGADYAERYNNVFGGGLKVFTTLDLQAQAVAEQVVRDGIPENDLGVVGVLTSVEPSTGAVRVMVGGPGFGQYNIATHEPGRQVGSSFKTYVLLTALEQGNVPQDFIDGGGSFKTPPGQPLYTMAGKGGSLTFVVGVSSNGAFVRLGQVVGLQNVVDLTSKLGIHLGLQTGAPIPVSLPLGVESITPIDMAAAYAAIPNGGVYEGHHLIERIEDRNGRIIYSHTPTETRAFSTQTACLATQILEDNVKSGTGTKARLPNQVAAGKTGTTDAHADVLFMGFTPYLMTAVWLGNPEKNTAIETLGGKENFGGEFPAKIWEKFNEAYHAQRPPLAFPTCDPVRGPRRVVGLGDNSLNGSGFAPRRATDKQVGAGGVIGRTNPPPTTEKPQKAPDPTADSGDTGGAAAAAPADPPTNDPGGGGGGGGNQPPPLITIPRPR